MLMQRWNQWECYLQRDLSNHGSRGGNIISNPAPSTETITPPFSSHLSLIFPLNQFSLSSFFFLNFTMPMCISFVPFYRSIFLCFFYTPSLLSLVVSLHLRSSFSVTVYLRFAALSGYTDAGKVYTSSDQHFSRLFCVYVCLHRL